MNIEAPDSPDFNEFVDQEVLVSRFYCVFDNGLEPLPLFIPRQSTLSQDDQSGMYFYIEQMDEVPRIRGDDRKILVQRDTW